MTIAIYKSNENLMTGRVCMLQKRGIIMTTEK